MIKLTQKIIVLSILFSIISTSMAIANKKVTKAVNKNKKTEQKKLNKKLSQKTFDFWSDTMLFGTQLEKNSILKKMRDIDDPRITKLLLENLKDETTKKEVRLIIIRLLYAKKIKEALDPLLTQLKKIDEDDEDMLNATISAIAILKDKRAASTLLPFLKNEKEIIVKTTVRALGEIDYKKAGPLLLTMLTNKETKKDVVYDIVNTLGKLQYKPAYKEIKEIAINKGKPKFLRCFAITAMGELKDKKALPVLYKMLKKESLPRIKLRLIGALGLIGDPESFKYLRFAMADGDKNIRKAAIRSISTLKNFDPQKAKRVLLYKLKYDKDPAVMVEAAKTLFKIDPKGARDIIIQKFKASYADGILTSLLVLLKEMKGADVLKALEAKLKEKQFSIMKKRLEAAIKDWGKIDPKKDNKADTKKTAVKDKIKKDVTKKTKKDKTTPLKKTNKWDDKAVK